MNNNTSISHEQGKSVEIPAEVKEAFEQVDITEICFELIDHLENVIVPRVFEEEILPDCGNLPELTKEQTNSITEWLLKTLSEKCVH